MRKNYIEYAKTMFSDESYRPYIVSAVVKMNNFIFYGSGVIAVAIIVKLANVFC